MKRVEGWPFLLLAGWLIAAPAWAQEPAAGNKAAGTDSGPSVEFLEFLGEFETDEGEWVGPEELERMDAIDESEKTPESKEQHD